MASAGQIWAVFNATDGCPEIFCFDGTTTYNYFASENDGGSGGANGQFSYATLLTGLGGIIIGLQPAVWWNGVFWQVPFFSFNGQVQYFQRVTRRSGTLYEIVIFPGLGLCICGGGTTWYNTLNGEGF